MEITKFFVKSKHGRPHVYMVGNHYGHSFATIKQMAEIARQDFPSLSDSGISFRTYRKTGNIDGMMGMEFQIPEGSQIPSGYLEADRLPSY